MKKDQNKEQNSEEMDLEEAEQIIEGLDENRVNKDGTPDMRLEENRNDPKIVAAFNAIRKAHQSGERAPGFNKNGTPDMRVKENRNDPEVVAEHKQRKTG